MRPERAIDELGALRREADAPEIRRSTPEHRAWKAKVQAVLARALGDDAPVLREFRDLRYHVGIWTGAPGEAEQDARYFAKRVDHAAGLIDAAIYELGLLAETESPVAEDSARGSGKELEHYIDDDAGYRRWLSSHPTGFVLNTGRNPTAAYLMLHRATCPTISGEPARGTTFTGEYSKVCGGKEDLEAFAGDLGGSPNPCRACIGPAGSAGHAGRYGPLHDHLTRADGSEVRMTFAAVEALVGPLPSSARLHRAWWSNSSGSSRAWREAGWHVRSVNQEVEEVVFARGAPERAVRGPREAPTPAPYVNVQIIAAIGATKPTDRFDRTKLLRLLGELNDNYGRGNAYATHMLLRAILDHIPPLLDCADFKEVANNYAWSRTDKFYVRKLLDFKLQADDALHRQISAKLDLLTLEDIPPRAWINRLLQECAI